MNDMNDGLPVSYFSAMPISLRVSHPRRAHIGDTLMIIPWALRLAEIHKKHIFLCGEYSRQVEPLLKGLPIECNRSVISGPVIEYTANVLEAFHHGNRTGIHELQSYFIINNSPVPNLPIDIPFYSEPSNLPSGVVISPFSASDANHNKLWWPDRWCSVIQHIRDRYNLPIYVVGGDVDDFSSYLVGGVQPITGFQLTKIVDLLVRCRMLISIDNALSHLAHFCAVNYHVLLYPACISASVTTNPRARIIRGEPADIHPEHIIEQVDSYLNTNLPSDRNL